MAGQEALGREYLLHEEIGRGALAVVRRASRRSGGPPLAAKLMRPELAGDRRVRALFLREETALRAVDHPGVVSFRDLVVEGGTLALLMDFVDGPDLRRHLADRGGRLTPAETTTILAQVASALDAAHARGVVHLDLKPENLMLVRASTPPEVRVTDFGVAALLMDADRGAAGGTPGYTAPEIWQGTPPTPAADVYSLGALLVELITGDLHQDPESLPPELSAPARSCLSPDPSRRPTARRVATYLHALAASKAFSTPTPYPNAPTSPAAQPHPGPAAAPAGSAQPYPHTPAAPAVPAQPHPGPAQPCSPAPASAQPHPGAAAASAGATQRHPGAPTSPASSAQPQSNVARSSAGVAQPDSSAPASAPDAAQPPISRQTTGPWAGAFTNAQPPPAETPSDPGHLNHWAGQLAGAPTDLSQPPTPTTPVGQSPGRSAGLNQQAHADQRAHGDQRGQADQPTRADQRARLGQWEPADQRAHGGQQGYADQRAHAGQWGYADQRAHAGQWDGADQRAAVDPWGPTGQPDFGGWLAGDPAHIENPSSYADTTPLRVAPVPPIVPPTAPPPGRNARRWRRGPLVTLGVVVAVAAALIGVNIATAADRRADQKTPAAVGATATPSASATTGQSAPLPPTDPVRTGPTSAAATPVRITLAGHVADDAGTLAISIRDQQAIAYICDGSKVEAWLKGTAENGTLTLTGKNGSKIVGSFDRDSAEGRVTIIGKTHTFTLRTVKKPSGLYRTSAKVRNAQIKGSWIVLPDGRQVGVLLEGDQPGPAPKLDVAGRTTTVDGTSIPVTAIDVDTGTGF